VQLEQRLGFRVGRHQAVIERDRSVRSTAFFCRAATCTIDQDMAHRDGRGAQEVRSVAPIRARRSRELEVQLVNERRRKERIARSHGQLAARGAPELLIHQREDSIECFAPAGAQILEESIDRLVESCLPPGSRRPAPAPASDPLASDPLVVHHGLDPRYLELKRVHRTVEGGHRLSAWSGVLTHARNAADRTHVAHALQRALELWLDYRDGVSEAARL